MSACVAYHDFEREIYMNILHLHHLKMSFAGRTIFDDVTYAIGDRDRTGFVGANGAGKSTLLKLLAGQYQQDAGQIVKHGEVRIGYLHQDIDLTDNTTLIEAAMVMPPSLVECERELREVEDKLSDPDVYGDEQILAKTLEIQEKILHRYESLNGHSHPAQVRKLLSMLGFTEDDYDLPTTALSGGQKKLVALVQLAVANPHVLLLDEPDNHLDVHGKHHLERFIHQYQGAIIIVSHDRYLLDEVATKIVELDGGKITEYVGNYSAYTTERELRRLRQQQLYVAQQKEIARIEAAIARFELWASLVVDERHIKQARSRRKMLDRMEERGEIIERVTEARKMGLELSGGRGSTLAIDMQDVAMAFDDDFIFADVNFTLRHGDRVGLVGANGAGKSVFFKLILEQYQPFSGIIKQGPSSKIGYYSQEHQTLDAWLDKTPLDLVRDIKIGGEGQAVSFLLKMLFKYEQVRQPIHTLSGGERSRLQLAYIMLQKPNVLLLDEPTNNLDIASVEVLEGVLDEFEGAILIISHDRYFLDNVVDNIIELEEGALGSFIGGYTDYLDDKQKM